MLKYSELDLEIKNSLLEIFNKKYYQMNQEQKQRLLKRVNEIRSAKNPNELSYTIWSKSLEEATSSKKTYRDSFVNWIESKKDGIEPQWKHYKTPSDLAEALWDKNLDFDDDDRIWFSALRKELINWINQYLRTSKIDKLNGI